MKIKEVKGIGICVAVAVIGLGSIAYANSIKNTQITAGVETIFANVDEEVYDTSGEEDPDYIGGAGVEVIFGTLDQFSQGDLQKIVAENISGEGIIGETEKKDDSLLWGYTNLGVANVTENLNIRKSPDTTSEIVGKLPRDSGCEILSMDNGWASIKSGKVEGYVSLEYLFVEEEAIARAEEVATVRATVTAQTLKVRKEASTDSGVRGLVANGTSFEVVDEIDGWVKVVFDDNEGYLSKDYVEVGEQLITALTITEEKYGVGVTDAGINVAEYAIQFVGNAYVYGGVSLTNGADCSGFTLSIFKKYGLSLSHSARAQSGYGSSVSISELKPGDLVFYSGDGGIDHVAIYIGNSQVVHASSPKNGILISNLNYRSPTCARRLL